MKDGLRRMMEGGNYCAVETVFLFVTAFIERSLGFWERCDRTQMIALYTEMVSKMLFDRIDGAQVKSELTRLRSEISIFKIAFQKTFALHCLSGLFTLRFCLQEHFGDNSKPFESLSRMAEGGGLSILMCFYRNLMRRGLGTFDEIA